MDVAAEMEDKYPNLQVLKYRALAPLLLKIRDKSTPHVQFKLYADRLMSILAEEGLASCASTTVTVETPTGELFTGVAPAENVCAVSIIRAGDSLLHAVISCDQTVAVGKILIQRDESSADKHPVMYYSKLPPKIEMFENVVVVDPMLGTGGSVKMAIKVSVGSWSVSVAVAGFNQSVHVKVVTTGVDQGLNEDKYLVPGIGDYGDRYFNTVHNPHHP
ncbi:hypothetical protein BBJ28_00010233 [Nothophytophthora sp. Chile5]|nr:hypothetical protein BBJ28_00010233 [Nothophytophthora sp. Chile5]